MISPSVVSGDRYCMLEFLICFLAREVIEMRKFNLLGTPVWLGVLLLFLWPSSVSADGLYVGLDMGVSIPGDLDVESSGVNNPTRCDPLLYPDGVRPAALAADVACADSTVRTLVKNSFNLGSGLAAGVAVGYAFGNLRVEVEYLNGRGSGEERRVDLGSAGNAALGTKDSEWSADSPPTERLDHVRSQRFFLNAYYDFPADSRLTPYLGAGVGFSLNDMDYRSRLERRADLADGAPADEQVWRQAAAGTVSELDTDISGASLAFQAIGGFDYALDERVALVAKLRWIYSRSFEDDDKLWKRIRSHAPLRDNGDPFTTDFDIGGSHSFAATLGLKYYL